MIHLLKKYFLLIFISLNVFILVACGDIKTYDIVTTLYPQYDIAKQISGEKLSVKLVTPFGSEIHAYEPTANDIINVKNAKLFIYTSQTMERWVKNILSDISNSLDLSSSYTLKPYQNEYNTSDVSHFWTDPTIILELINAIRDEIIKIDEANKSYYEENALNYYNEMYKIHHDLETLLSDKNTPSVYFYGHNAMSPFGNRYQINIVSLSSNYKPDSELSQGQLLELKNKIKNANAKYLFVEELINMKAPNALKNELHHEGYEIEILELHGFHNITSKQNKEGLRYVDLLKRNLENIGKIFS